VKAFPVLTRGLWTRLSVRQRGMLTVLSGFYAILAHQMAEQRSLGRSSEHAAQDMRCRGSTNR
jgi:hypothetical protein